MIDHEIDIMNNKPSKQIMEVQTTNVSSTSNLLTQTSHPKLVNAYEHAIKCIMNFKKIDSVPEVMLADDYPYKKEFKKWK